MNKFFISKLALNNIRKQKKIYLPFILTTAFIVMMFYNMSFLAFAENVGALSNNDELRITLAFGTVIMTLFSFIFIIYMNNYLLKRRQKELGLYSILGLEKKHIIQMMIVENTLTFLTAMIIGLLCGILFSKLFLLLLAKIISYDVPFGFEISIDAVIYSLILFGVIFTINTIYNAVNVFRYTTSQLFIESNAGQKKPKGNLFIAIIGLLTLALGYTLALNVEGAMEAIFIFFVASILVIIGTYCLFTSLSIYLLNILKRNKNIYYKANNFITINGLLFRVKQNAIGLANICILSTMVIVTLATTSCLYFGVEEVVNTRYPYDVTLVSKYHQNTVEIERLMLPINNKIKDLTIYDGTQLYGYVDENGFQMQDIDFQNYYYNVVHMYIPLESYNQLTNGNYTLKDNEVMVYAYRGDKLDEKIIIDGNEYTITNYLNDFPMYGQMVAMMYDTYYIVSDKLFNDYADAAFNFYNFNINGNTEDRIEVSNYIKANSPVFYEAKEIEKLQFYSLYGGLFYIGILLGTIFLMATVLVIYYKQINESYEDKQAFDIMMKVGMSHDETRKTINALIRAVILLPLVVMIIHIIFAFPLIVELLTLFNLSNIKLFITCILTTILIFGLIYFIAYKSSTNIYYDNINESE